MNLREQIAKRLFEVDSEIYGGFFFNWETMGEYRRNNYLKRADAVLEIMGLRVIENV